MPPRLQDWSRALLHRIRTVRAHRAVARFRRPVARPHGLSALVIISLTSYPPRFATLHLTLSSLLMQTVQADRLILWIGQADMVSLPPEVLALEALGVEIRATEDLRSYKKFVPALRDFPDANIVTADDDLYYGPHWLEMLVDGAKGAPGAIVCRRAHRPKWRGKTLLPYGQWDHDIVTGGKVDPMIFPTSGGGALYPPGSLAPETCDSEAFLALSPTADDVWLFVMALRAGSRFRQVGPGFVQICWQGSQETSLMQANLVADGNDRQLMAVVDHFGARSLLKPPGE
jgi:hypothetical protein